MGAGFFDRDEIDFGSAGAEVDVALVSGARAFGIGGAPLGVGEVKVFGGFKKAEVLFHISEGAAGAEAFENAGLGGGADGAKEGVGMLFVLDVDGGGELGEDGQGGILLRGGKEAAERGTGGDEVKTAVVARFAEDLDGVIVGVAGAEVENVLLVLGREDSELIFGLFHQCHNEGSVAEGVRQIWSEGAEGGMTNDQDPMSN